MNIGWHHLHSHYKLPDEHSPLLRNPRVQRFVNRGVYAIAILGVSATIPQILKIWVDRTAEGVSLLTWMAFIVSSIFWLTYGLIHRDKAIILSSSGSLVANILIVVGVLTVS